MTEEEFEKLIKKDKYQVFVLMSPASFFLAKHPWFVVNKKGEIHRYEIRHHLNESKMHLHVDKQPPFQGMPLIYPIQKFFLSPKFLKMIVGDENSRAKELVDFIEKSKEDYPFLKNYTFLGANCATYVAWVFKSFPEMEVQLPWNAVGKDFS